MKAVLFCLLLATAALPAALFAAPAPAPAAQTERISAVDPSTPISDNELNYQDPGTRAQGSGIFFTLLRLLVSFGLVVGLIFAASWGLKKLNRNNILFGQKQDLVNVLHCSGIGPKKYIYIVEALGKVLVLGVTDAQINVLFETDDQAFIKSLKERKDQSPAVMPPAGSFMAHLKQISERFNK